MAGLSTNPGISLKPLRSKKGKKGRVFPRGEKFAAIGV
jgi:hypothetical protein